MLLTASKSSGDATGKPASMISTPSFESCLAMSSFSLLVKVAPANGKVNVNPLLLAYLMYDKRLVDYLETARRPEVSCQKS